MPFHYDVDDFKRPEDWFEAVKNIPTTDYQLELRQKDFKGQRDLKDKTLSPQEIIALLKVIPKHVEDLLFSEFALGQYQTEAIIEIVKAIPPHITNLTFIKQGLGPFRPEAELKAIFAATPNTVRTLTLEQQGITDTPFGDGSLASVFSKLPAHIQHLGLCRDALDEREVSNQKAKNFLILLSKTVKEVTVGDNVFGNKSTDQSIDIFSALPNHVRNLYFQGSKSPTQLVADEFVQVIKKLPTHLKILGFVHGSLQLRTTDDIVKILAALPANLEELDLTGNNLGARSRDELRSIMQALPQGLKKLYLGGNNITKDKAALNPFLKVLPPTISVSFNDDGKDLIKPSTFRSKGKDEEKLLQEIRRLRKYETKAASFWVRIGLIDPSAAKIVALEGLITLLKNIDEEPVETKKALGDWKTSHEACLKQQRNRIDRFFRPKHQPKSKQVVDTVLAECGLQL